MSEALWIDYASQTWTLIKASPKDGKTACGFCGKAFRKNAKRYRTKTWGPSRDQVEEYHQRCLIGQLDPSIYDIPIGR